MGLKTLKRHLLSVAGWFAVGLVLWIVFMFNDTLANIPVDWRQQFVSAMVCAVLWAGVVPLIRFLARRMPLNEGLQLGYLSLHLLCSLLFSLLMTLLLSWVFMVGRQLVYQQSVPFSDMFPSVAYYFTLAKVVFYWAVVATDNALIYLKRFRREAAQAAILERELGQARMNVLQAQLQPHFLFNTLHSLGALIRTEQATQAEDVLVNLGDLLRYALKVNKHQWVPLATEVALVKKYIAIEQVRFESRVVFEVVVAEEMLGCAVPQLIVQPLVENAVRHGIEKRADASFVRLEIRAREDRLIIQVTDDGPGFPAGWSLDQHAGTGLGHTASRLNYLYDIHYQLCFETMATGGAVVTLNIPIKHPGNHHA